MFKRITAILLSTAVVVGYFAFSPVSASAAGNSSWIQSNQNLNSRKLKGWVLINTKWYYYNDSNVMFKGWLLYNSKWYYFNANGDMQTGWLLYNNKWYYFNANGDMAVNTVTPDGYQIGEDGVWIEYLSKTDAPKGVTAKAISYSEIQLQWQDEEYVDYYYVYYSLDSDKDFKPIVDKNDSKKKFEWNSSYSAALTNIVPDTKIYFKVTAVKDNAESTYGEIAYATTEFGPLTAPTGVEARTLSSSSIELKWDEVVGSDYYNVYYRDSKYHNYNVVKCTTNSFILSDLNKDTKVYFYVQTVKGDEESKYSSQVNATTDNKPILTAPENIDVKALSSSSLEVSWDKASEADYYNIYYREDGQDNYTKVRKTSLIFVLTDLKPETKVYFKVTSGNNGSESDSSSEIIATIDDYTTPRTPESVAVKVLSSNSIEVNWDKVSGADYYYVFCKKNSDNVYTKTKVTTNHYIITNLDPETNFYFKIKAVNEQGQSDYSSEVSVTN